MSVLFRKLINPIIEKSNEEKERTEQESRRYLIVIFTRNDNEDIKTFRWAIGRDNAIETIYEIYEEYGYINWFKSIILSDKVTIENAISLYSFFRLTYTLEREDFCIPAIDSVDDLDDFIMEAGDMCQEDFEEVTLNLGIDNLDDFYNKDISHQI